MDELKSLRTTQMDDIEEVFDGVAEYLKASDIPINGWEDRQTMVRVHFDMPKFMAVEMLSAFEQMPDIDPARYIRDAIVDKLKRDKLWF